MSKPTIRDRIARSLKGKCFFVTLNERQRYVIDCIVHEAQKEGKTADPEVISQMLRERYGLSVSKKSIEKHLEGWCGCAKANKG